MSKTLQVIVVCLVAAVSFATAKPAYVYAPGVPVDTPEVAAAKAAHFHAHAVARTGLIHPYYAGHVPLALPYIAHAVADQTGAYVHDPSGDVAVPYIHDLSGEYAPAYAYAVPGAYAAPVIVNGVPADTPEVAAAKAAHLAAHAALG